MGHFVPALNGSCSCPPMGRDLGPNPARYNGSCRHDTKLFWAVPCLGRAFFSVLRAGPSGPAQMYTYSASGATATSHQRSSAEDIKCATVRAEVRARAEGAPDSLQDLSGAPSDCPVSQMSEAPTVRIQRPGDVTGAPDCPVCHATEALTNGSFGGWGYKYPQPPHFNAAKFSAFKHLTRAIAFNTRHNQRDQILSQVQRSFQSNSDS
jgi:hypothetical protein